MPPTLKSLRAEIQRECRGDFSGNTDEDMMVNSAINDALESIWIAMMQVQLAKFFGADSPVTFNLPQGSERITLVSILDPLVPTNSMLQIAGALPFRVINSAFTYVTESGSETNLSPIQQYSLQPNTLLVVSQPSTTNIPQCIGWNFYASIFPDQVLALQNQQPIPMAATFVEPLQGLTDYAASQQQAPISNTTADNISWIEHMEIRTSDTLLRAWNQADIDSEVMRRMARTLSTASEYQSYVWELTNNGVLEFRPMTGLSFSPRYWYIAKPRRLRYDPSEIPYVNIPGVIKYLKCQAKTDLFLGVDEYIKSDNWEKKAGAEKLSIQMALTQELWAKNTRVVPHLW